MKKLLPVVVVLVLAAGAGVWYFVLRDTSDPTASVDAVTAGQGNAGNAAATGAARDKPDGTWQVKQADTVFVGYRVNETFVSGNLSKTANGRTPAVTGNMTVLGSQIPTADFTADLSKLKSDEVRRDNQVRQRGIETDKFPEASFKLTSPIALPAAPKNGESVDVTAKGELTLHGVTKAVDAPLKAKWENSTISVSTVGEGIPVVFADYGIQAIELAGFVKTEDRGTIEVQLLFVPV